MLTDYHLNGDLTVIGQAIEGPPGRKGPPGPPGKQNPSTIEDFY